MDTTNEKLKQRLKDLYGAPIEYSFGQIAEASGMALDRIEKLESKLAAAERRERQLLDTTATCRTLRRELNTAKAKLAEVEDDVLTSVGETLAGMPHEHASPYARIKIKDALCRALFHTGAKE